MRPVTADVGDDQRLGHEIGEVIGDVHRSPVTGNLDHRIQQEIPGKYSELPQDPRLRLREQIVAPVERRAQRLLPGQRRSPARRQEFEPVVQQGRDVRRPEHHRARRGKLDRERNAIQPPANGGDRAEVLLVLLEIRTQRLRPGHEQLDRGVLEAPRPVRAAVRAAHPAQGRDRHVRHRYAKLRGWSR